MTPQQHIAYLENLLLKQASLSPLAASEVLRIRQQRYARQVAREASAIDHLKTARKSLLCAEADLDAIGKEFGVEYYSKLKTYAGEVNDMIDMLKKKASAEHDCTSQ